MKISKADGRDRKRNRRKNGMRVTGKSIFTIVGAQVKRAEEVKDGNH